MRTHPIYCDWCDANITKHLIVYSHKNLQPHVTWEGARDTYDFCSDAHLLAWKDEAALRKLTTERTHRSGPIALDDMATYQAQLTEEVAVRIEEAVRGPYRNRVDVPPPLG